MGIHLCEIEWVDLGSPYQSLDMRSTRNQACQGHTLWVHGKFILISKCHIS